MPPPVNPSLYFQMQKSIIAQPGRQVNRWVRAASALSPSRNEVFNPSTPAPPVLVVSIDVNIRRRNGRRKAATRLNSSRNAGAKPRLPAHSTILFTGRFLPSFPELEGGKLVSRRFSLCTYFSLAKRIYVSHKAKRGILVWLVSSWKWRECMSHASYPAHNPGIVAGTEFSHAKKTFGQKLDLQPFRHAGWAAAWHTTPVVAGAYVWRSSFLRFKPAKRAILNSYTVGVPVLCQPWKASVRQQWHTGHCRGGAPSWCALLYWTIKRRFCTPFRTFSRSVSFLDSKCQV